MATAYCKSHTDAYRKCLKDCRDAGQSRKASKTCKPLAVRLDSCRQEWREKHETTKTDNVNPSSDGSRASFDGTRILPHPKCRPLSCDVQRCIQWKQGDQAKCQREIKKLRDCMAVHKGTLAKPTEGDKVWTT